MKKVSAILVISTLILVSLVGCNKTTLTQKHIDDNGLNATIIVSSLNTKKEYVINKERSVEGFLPASTFKIPNTLIALQEGAVADADEVIKWNGKDYGWSEWNKDQTLRTAISSSTVWVYQELARRIGFEAYDEYLKEMNYGNGKTGGIVDTFWLEGDIRISAKEQIEFLKKLYNEEFAFDKEHYALLKELMIVEKNDEYVIRAKTGWAQRVEPQTGWYVGYVETSNDVWFFALNLEVVERTDADYRDKLVFSYLRDLEIIK